jgi:hypothetical protein
MDYKNKYLKYKNKYLELKKMSGGVNKQSPFLLYIIGEETGNISQRSYLCTFLHQIDFIKRYCNITNDRIHLIYGKNGNENILHTCEHPRAGIMADKPIPYGIDVTYVDDTYDAAYLQQTITDILRKKLEPNTPIIFIYDGHGYTNPVPLHGEGEMILNNNLSITPNMLHVIFKPFDLNKKLIVFTQCGSFGFYRNLIALPNILLNTVYLCSTHALGQCGLGARVLVKLSELINTNPVKYLFFRDIGIDLIATGYHTEDLTPIKISDILLTYQGKAVLQNGDRVELKTSNNIYMGYTMPNTVRNQIESTMVPGAHNHLFNVEFLQNNNIRIKTNQQYQNAHTHQNEHAYVDIYDKSVNTSVYLWNDRPGSDKQEFILNADNTISPIYDPNSCLAYNHISRYFVHKQKGTILPQNLVKINKI